MKNPRYACILLLSLTIAACGPAAERAETAGKTSDKNAATPALQSDAEVAAEAKSLTQAADTAAAIVEAEAQEATQSNQEALPSGLNKTTQMTQKPTGAPQNAQ